MKGVTEMELNFSKLNRKLDGLTKASCNGQMVKDLSLVMRMPEIWQLAYTNIYSNKGAMTKGIDDDTLDGMSIERIQGIINSIKTDKYKPKPVRRAYIPKRDGKKRPLGVPSGNDKLAQAVIKILLQQIYEPIFSEMSHGFRPEKSCHTALDSIKKKWTGTDWFIEFDIQGCFDNINHAILIKLLKDKIADKNFIKLVKRFLEAGYLEDWKYHHTYSGTPQGGIISPILSNIYLHELDSFIRKYIDNFNIGKKRPVNPEYRRIDNRLSRLRYSILPKRGLTPDEIEELKALKKELLKTKRTLEDASKFRKLSYCRYADDFIIGIMGSYSDSKTVMESVIDFLSQHLQLETSSHKSGIVKATKTVEFLGYNIKKLTGRIRKIKTKKGIHKKLRTGIGAIRLEVPKDKVLNFCNAHKYGDWQANKASHRAKLLTSSEVEIILTYNAEKRGLANYYTLANDMKYKLHKLDYMGLVSLVKTLASKSKSSVAKTFGRLNTGRDYSLNVKVKGDWKRYQVFQLKHWKQPSGCEDALPITAHLYKTGTELIKRLNANECEYCRVNDKVEAHHVHKLKDLTHKPHLEHWEKVMIARNRKTIILCVKCHNLLHQGKLPDKRFKTKA
jgi:RNA-directed DNA polymerase